ncbi:MAG: hypothetical protein LBQ49_02590 [Rickettsiales bacterium]|jgi:hypothetical protein|nr:hypothetical protein [Rickettsiales bacterium]
MIVRRLTRPIGAAKCNPAAQHAGGVIDIIAQIRNTFRIRRRAPGAACHRRPIALRILFHVKKDVRPLTHKYPALGFTALLVSYFTASFHNPSDTLATAARSGTRIATRLFVADPILPSIAKIVCEGVPGRNDPQKSKYYFVSHNNLLFRYPCSSSYPRRFFLSFVIPRLDRGI